jgi:hypothetical protein
MQAHSRRHDPRPLVADINPGPDSSVPFPLTVLNGDLYFGAFAPPATGRELYKLAPGRPPPALVADINPDRLGSNSDWLL